MTAPGIPVSAWYRGTRDTCACLVQGHQGYLCLLGTGAPGIPVSAWYRGTRDTCACLVQGHQGYLCLLGTGAPGIPVPAWYRGTRDSCACLVQGHQGFLCLLGTGAPGIPVSAWYRGAPWAGCCPRLPVWYDRVPWLVFIGGVVPAGRLTTGFWPVARRPGCALLGTVKTGVGPARLNTLD